MLISKKNSFSKHVELLKTKAKNKRKKVVTKHTFVHSQNMKISTTSKENKLHNKKNARARARTHTHTHTYIHRLFDYVLEI